MKEKLKIGVLLDSLAIPKWVFRIVKEITNSNYAVIELVVVNELAEENTPLKRGKGQRAFSLIKKVEKLIFTPESDALAPQSLEHILPKVKVIPVLPKRKGNTAIFPTTVIAQLKKQAIDVFLQIGFKRLKGDILTIPKIGTFGFYIGNKHLNSDLSPAAQEVVENWNEVGLSLHLLKEELADDIIISRSFSGMDEEISINRMLHKLYWKAAVLALRNLEDLYQLGEKAFFEKVAKKNHPVFLAEFIKPTPSNFKVLLLASKLYLQKAWTKLYYQFHFEQWILLYQFGNQPSIAKPLNQFKKLMPPKSSFWADPFVVIHDDQYFLFFEELHYERGIGHISYTVIDEQGNYAPPKKILETPYHLSYPFIFQQEETYYMIPETGANKTIELYQCTAFPEKWELVHTIMEGVAALDTTIHYQNGYFWLFTNIKANEEVSSHEDLFLFYAKDLLAKEWIAHPLNPIVSDVRKARPAGKLFEQDGNLYRPSQDCSKTYGYGMHINQVITLNETEYEEQTVNSIFPNWEKNLIGTHSLNFGGKLTVIDAMINRRKWGLG